MDIRGTKRADQESMGISKEIKKHQGVISLFIVVWRFIHVVKG